MSNIYDAFETDDPDQMSDILLATIGELIEADRAGDGPIIEELWEKVEEMIASLVEAVWLLITHYAPVGFSCCCFSSLCKAARLSHRVLRPVQVG